jgi:hypothetical protein
MAGRVVVSTLNNDTGVLATQNGMTGIAKAWVNFNGTGTVAIRDSFNVSSITDNGTGDYTVNFTTALPNANYSCVSGLTSDGSVGTANPRVAEMVTTSTSAMRMLCMGSTDGSATDCSGVYVIVCSS